jgi:hypothetical protein
MWDIIKDQLVKKNIKNTRPILKEKKKLRDRFITNTKFKRLFEYIFFIELPEHT